MACKAIKLNEFEIFTVHRKRKGFSRKKGKFPVRVIKTRVLSVPEPGNIFTA